MGRSRLAAVAATGLAALVAGTFGFVLAADPATADTTGASADGLPAAPQAARQAQEARTYTWTAVPSAVAYRFEILRGEDAVFETTTADISVELPVNLRLLPGHYTWSVTPTFENQSAVLLRRPVVKATFEVATT